MAKIFSFAGLGRKPRAEEEKPDDEETTGEEGTDEEEDSAEGEDNPDDEAGDGTDDEESDDAAEGDDEDKDSAKANLRLGAKRERTRWAAVLSSKAAAGRVESACHMLANTAMSAKNIVGTLQTMPKAGGPNGFDKVMRGVGNPALGADGDGGTVASNLSESDKRLVQFSKTVQQARKRA